MRLRLATHLSAPGRKTKLALRVNGMALRVKTPNYRAGRLRKS